MRKHIINNRTVGVIVSALLLVVAPAFGLQSLTHQTAYAQEQEETQPEAPAEETKVTINPGDTLSKIAKAHDTTYVRIFNANTEIEHPDIIYPGDELIIPHKDAVLEERELPGSAPEATVQKTTRQSTATPKTVRKQRTAPAQVTNSVSGGVWDRLAACESSGNWSINTGNGYYGGLQFSLSSWRAVGGSGYPHQASKAEQINRAEKLKAIQGWGAWPACTKKLGLR